MAFEHVNIVGFLLICGFISLFFYFFYKTKKNSNLYIRKILGIDAINDVCDYAGETGKPISFSTGLSPVGPVLYASLGVLSFVAKKAATFKNRLLVPQYTPEVMAIVEETVEDAYESVNRVSFFDKKDIRFLSDEQFAYASGYIGMIKRENVAATFLFGTFAAESLILAEAGKEANALQVGATISPEQVAFFIASCDYTLIGEELFAASSYLTRKPIEMTSIYTQDKVKLFIFFIIIVGSVIATLNQIFPTLKLENLDYFLKI